MKMNKIIIIVGLVSVISVSLLLRYSCNERNRDGTDTTEPNDRNRGEKMMPSNEIPDTLFLALKENDVERCLPLLPNETHLFLEAKVKTRQTSVSRPRPTHLIEDLRKIGESRYSKNNAIKTKAKILNTFKKNFEAIRKKAEDQGLVWGKAKLQKVGFNEMSYNTAITEISKINLNGDLVLYITDNNITVIITFIIMRGIMIDSQIFLRHQS